MDMFLNAAFWIVQVCMALLGVYVSLKSQPREKHLRFILAFIILSIIGGVINTIQTVRNGSAQNALRISIQELRDGQSQSNSGIAKMSSDFAQLEKNTQQPPNITVSMPAEKRRAAVAMQSLKHVYYPNPLPIGERVGMNAYFINNGTAPADNFRGFSEVIIKPDLTRETQDNIIKALDKHVKEHQNVVTPASLPAGGGQRLWFTMEGMPLTKDQLDGLQDGSMHLFLAWKVQFDDPSGHHFLKQCAYLQSPPFNPEIWHACDTPLAFGHD